MFYYLAYNSVSISKLSSIIATYVIGNINIMLGLTQIGHYFLTTELGLRPSPEDSYNK